VSRLCFLRQIRPLVSPFPPVGTVAAPCGSPAVPRSRRYYGFVRLLSIPPCPSGLPWGHVPPDVRGVPLGVGGDEELSWFLGNPLGSMPRARDSGDPGPPLPYTGVRVLPSALLTASASRSRLFSELDPHGLLPCCVRFVTHQSPGEWQHSLPTCRLRIRRVGLSPAGFL
jgi:hypothetical protein